MNLLKFSFRIPIIFYLFYSLTIFSSSFDDIRILGHLGTIKESLLSIRQTIEEKKDFLVVGQGGVSEATFYQITDRSKFVISKDDIKFNLSIIRKILPELNRFIKPADQTQVLFIVSNFDMFLRECKKQKSFGKTEYDIGRLEKMIEVMLNNSDSWITELELEVEASEMVQFRSGETERHRRQSFRRRSVRPSSLYSDVTGAFADEKAWSSQVFAPQPQGGAHVQKGGAPLAQGNYQYPTAMGRHSELAHRALARSECAPPNSHTGLHPGGGRQPSAPHLIEGDIRGKYVLSGSHPGGSMRPSAPPPVENVDSFADRLQVLKEQERLRRERAAEQGPPQYQSEHQAVREASVHDRVSNLDRRSRLLQELNLLEEKDKRAKGINPYG